MKDKIAEIDNHIKNYYFSQKKISEIRQNIAEQRCPLNLGDTISYIKNNKSYQGIVENIVPIVKNPEYTGPIEGNEVGWGICGARVLKSTQKPGKISFGINEFTHFIKDEMWQEEELTDEERLNRFLGI